MNCEDSNEELPMIEGMNVEWIEQLLEKSFFESCPIHPIKKNEENRYCIPCQLPVCQYCESFHRNHKTLKIYKHVYQDVVSLEDMKEFMDCSQIQPYKSNKKLIISLNPLPHSQSGSSSSNGVMCDSCTRKLYEPERYRYCCISCKLIAFASKENDSEPPFISIQQNKESTSKRKRKGIPRRAPFY